MLFSFIKLKQIANLSSSITIDDLIHAINSIGFEVENFWKFTNIEGLKFGKILEITKNKNDSKLNICRTKFYDKERVIQTSANNLKENDIAIAFISGSKKDEIIFDSKEIKGVVSEGMFVSLDELGINKELVRESNKNKLLKINEIIDLSIDPIEYLQLNDYIIDVKILSNRADANSYFCFALEISAFFESKINFPKRKKFAFKSSLNIEENSKKYLCFVEGKNDFHISLLDQILLNKSNIKSINNIIDLTNLILIMTGQPTHAYDKEKIGNNFKVQNFSGKCKIFGNKDVQLDENLVTLSDNQIISISGVIGIEGFGVTNETNEFILEFGRFNTNDIRKSIKTTKLATISSIQSSKEITRGLTKLAIDFLSNIIYQFSEPVNEINEHQKILNFNIDNISKLAGENVLKNKNFQKTINSLKILGYKIFDEKIQVPDHISGIESEQDISEEFFRFFGFENLSPKKPIFVSNNRISNISQMNKIVASTGYLEIITYSLISNKKNIFNPFNFDNNIKLKTFISHEREVIRNSLAISLLDVIDYNVKRKIDNLSIFEIAMVNNGIKTLCLASTTKSFNQMLIDAQNILQIIFDVERFEDKNIHSGISAKLLYKNNMIGWVGRVHPNISEVNAFILEVQIPTFNEEFKFQSYSQEPMKQRDITFSLGIKEDLKEYINDLKSIKDIYSIEIIDSFIKEKNKHVTFRITGTENTIEIFDKKYNS